MTPDDHVQPIGPIEGGMAGRRSYFAPETSAAFYRDRTRLARAGIVAGALLGILLAFGAVQHYLVHRKAVAAAEARRQAVPQVRVVQVKVTNSPRGMALPGTIEAFESATIYARQSGYLAERRVDIGSRVKAGDLLAVIAAPEIDDQLAQARAQLTQLQAALRQSEAQKSLAEANDRRTASLVEKGWQSQQQGDTDRLNLQAQIAAVNVAQANLKAQQAQVERLEKESGYEKIVAPFDGVVTQRSVDVGSLVTADSTAGSALFAIARTDTVRVQVNIPQDVSFGLKDGVAANIHVAEILPGRVFTGHVARTANALQTGTRTMLAEIDVDNQDGALTPGLYCTVDFEIPRAKPVLEIPADALIVNRDGMQVAVYENGRARIRKVTLLQDNGDSVDVATGLDPADQVIVSLPVDLTDGAPVSIRETGASGSQPKS